MRFGVVGTSYWARATHAAGIQASTDAELVGVWGRDPAKTAAIAATTGSSAYGDYFELLRDVDAVTFSVPPQVQAELAVAAAEAGKHLLLEKPVAVDTRAAHALQSAVDVAGVASVVFFTGCFTPEQRAWRCWMQERGPWRAASAAWRGAAFFQGSPFDTPWRHDKGALWDVGPHALAALTDGLGPVERVLFASRAEPDLIHAVLRHEGGATSSLAATLRASLSAAGAELRAWSDEHVTEMPRSAQSPVDSFTTAVDELTHCAKSGQSHSHDVAFGCRIVQLLAEIEARAR